ncbi:hypothetical protein [Pedobacter deserti]|uniref:hypothetical protein n=1 Tax=Pedobacter deserti TaxID=2817382 RepID=UPI0021094952|nr:hypothetical protein [Pedobacter sp. SYSU D00382]
MIKTLKHILGFSILLTSITVGRAQHSFSFNNEPVLAKYQDSLVALNSLILASENNASRFEHNAAFIKTLVNALKTPFSFAFPFDSLKTISVVKSPDNALRILSWSVPADDGSYRFFGAIQMATTNGQLKLYPLIDQTDNLKTPYEVTDHQRWYGARYYEIGFVPGTKPYYVLLGWKGNNQKTTKKVIEVLSFEKDLPVFGKPVFEGSKSVASKNRIIFEYNKMNSMTLTIDKSVNLLVFDHLAPFTPDMEGNFEYYASDLSFDAFKFVNSKLRLVENVELKNEPNEMDDFYIDPEDKSTTPVKKL